jgi:hypothetical protein
MRLDEYRRVSQVAGREGDGFQSPELQAKAIAAHAGIHGHAVTPNPVELDVSASKLKRPILDRIIARIRNRMFAKRIYTGELSRRGVTNREACEPLVTEAESHIAILQASRFAQGSKLVRRRSLMDFLLTKPTAYSKVDRTVNR